MKLYNSYTNTKQTLEIKNNKVSLYVCGPTVYNYIHIGNARPVITFDILRRALEFMKVEVIHTSNFTDIDDKIIKQSIKEGVSEKELSRKYIDAFNKDIESFNVLKPNHQPLVTDTMSDIIKIIEKLVRTGYAYTQEDSGDIYFNTDKSLNYGQLANIKLDELINNASNRLKDSEDEGTNFILWKKTTEGITFDSPWGKGRPGWHTECVAMINNQYQEETIDIHGGGLDLKFPHHVNEIAQSDALRTQPLAHIWMHNGFVNFGTEKMAKSLGNIVLLKDALNDWGMEAIKLLFLSTHYQKPIKYTEQELKQQQKVWKKIKNTLSNIKELGVEKKATEGKFIESTIEALQDNLNTSNVLTSLFAAMKSFNIARKESVPEAKLIAKEILAILLVLGLI